MKPGLKIAFLFAVISVFSCRKYEDGPSFSLLSKKARLANTWYVDKYFLNGVDKTTEYRSLISRESMTISQNGDFSYSEVSTWIWAAPEYTAHWKFTDKKESIEVSPDNSAMPVQTYHILRLKKGDLWMERQVSPDSLVEFHYLPVE